MFIILQYSILCFFNRPFNKKMLVVITGTVLNWTHLPIGNCVVIYSHLRVHVLQVPTEASAFEPLPQGHPLRHIPEINPWVLLGTQIFFFSWHSQNQSPAAGPEGRENPLEGRERAGGRKEKRVFPYRKPMCQSSGTLIVLSLGVIQCCANSNQLFNYERSRPCWLWEREASQIDVGNT